MTDLSLYKKTIIWSLSMIDLSRYKGNRVLWYEVYHKKKKRR